MLKPVEGGFHPHKTNSAEANYKSQLAAAKAQHGGANVFNPIGTNPVYGDQPVKRIDLMNPNSASITTFDNRPPENPQGSSGNYGTEYTSSTEIPGVNPEMKGMKANEGRLALALQGKSYFANLNDPMGRGQQLYG